MLWLEWRKPKSLILVRGQENGIPSELVPDVTHFNFFRWQWLTFGISAAAMVLSLAWPVPVMGLNFGIDFKGGTTIRTESSTNFEVGDYRQALDGLGLADVPITEVFDPSFGTEKHVAMIRIGTQDETGWVTPEELNRIETARRLPIRRSGSRRWNWLVPRSRAS